MGAFQLVDVVDGRLRVETYLRTVWLPELVDWLKETSERSGPTVEADRHR